METTKEKTKTSSLDQNEKVIAAVAYIIFFLPLLTTKTQYTLYHANQAFNLFLASLAIWIGGMVLAAITLGLAAPLVMLASLGTLVLAIMGIINALNGEKKELPLIGKYKFVELK